MTVDKTGIITPEGIKLAGKVDDAVVAERSTARTLTNFTEGATTLTSSTISFGGGHALKTLSANEEATKLLTFTNADATATALITPTANMEHYLINSSGQSVVLKAPGQSGVTIANGKAALAIGNGTDIVRLTADA